MIDTVIEGSGKCAAIKPAYETNAFSVSGTGAVRMHQNDRKAFSIGFTVSSKDMVIDLKHNQQFVVLFSQFKLCT
jgi:hypothetical protein